MPVGPPEFILFDSCGPKPIAYSAPTKSPCKVFRIKDSPCRKNLRCTGLSEKPEDPLAELPETKIMRYSVATRSCPALAYQPGHAAKTAKEAKSHRRGQRLRNNLQILVFFFHSVFRQVWRSFVPRDLTLPQHPERIVSLLCAVLEFKWKAKKQHTATG